MNETMNYSLNELAGLWDVSYFAVWQWINNGKLNGYMEDGEWRVAKTDALQFAHAYGTFPKSRLSIKDRLNQWYESESKLELRIRDREEAEALRPLNKGYIKETIYQMETNMDVLKSYVDRINRYISVQEGLISQLKSLV